MAGEAVGLIVLKNGTTVSSEELRTFLVSRFAKWQLPDDFVYLPELPHTSTGKLLKSELRQRYKTWSWQSEKSEL